MKQKAFDAVKMMREIRDKLVKEFAQNPAMEEQQLKKINAQYNLKVKEQSQIK